MVTDRTMKGEASEFYSIQCAVANLSKCLASLLMVRELLWNAYSSFVASRGVDVFDLDPHQ